MDDLFEELFGIAFLLFMAFGAVIVAVTLFLMVLPYLILAALAGAACYGLFKLACLTWEALQAWNWRRINSPKYVAKGLDADHAATKQSMFDLAEPWQKLVK